ncbi:MAG TPA: dihydrolipoamide acetyltransferase family protein [Candidatus Nitrosotalea sp.]|nr:dihydrolipoamide acetyltransferase family protein [Candidatus Nitrosotalea sp.]
MAIPVVMPALGMAQSTGRLMAWLKREGEHVDKGELLMEVETDKAVVEVESQAEGWLGGILIQEGDEVPVGDVIAYLLGAGESAPETAAARISPSAAGAAAPEALEASPAAPPPPASGRTLASPKARRLAGELGIELSQLTGTGPAGAVQAADVKVIGGTTPAPSGPAPTPAGVDTGSQLWAAMAENMVRSWREIPHFYLARDVDARDLVRSRAAESRSVSLGDLVMHRVAAVLARHQLVNSNFREVNLGLAVATDQGLLVPVIRSADRLSLRELADRRAELVERARAGRMRLGDLEGATFTVSNLGMFGVDSFSAIVPTGQAAILALGRVAERVVAGAAGPEQRPMMSVTLSCDHRRIDGARAAAFLQQLTWALEADYRDQAGGGVKASSTG